jgi:hypothetical protein
MAFFKPIRYKKHHEFCNFRIYNFLKFYEVLILTVTSYFPGRFHSQVLLHWHLDHIISNANIIAYLLIQYIPAVTVATPTGFGTSHFRGEKRMAANGAPMTAEA